MIADPIRCPKCDGKMVRGFLFEAAGNELASWVEGPPESSVWGSAKAPKDKRVPVGTFRCSGCGFLESYARQDLAAI